ncbi:MAG: hypothetical protein J0M00_05840 [Burkholderiales bacterium]|nr:hypothetical protein [Burkholderiales bacterium]
MALDDAGVLLCALGWGRMLLCALCCTLRVTLMQAGGCAAPAPNSCQRSQAPMDVRELLFADAANLLGALHLYCFPQSALLRKASGVGLGGPVGHTVLS